MTFWEFRCAVSGWISANIPQTEKPPEISTERLAELGIEGF